MVGLASRTLLWRLPQGRIAALWRKTGTRGELPRHSGLRGARRITTAVVVELPCVESHCPPHSSQAMSGRAWRAGAMCAARLSVEKIGPAGSCSLPDRLCGIASGIRRRRVVHGCSPE